MTLESEQLGQKDFAEKPFNTHEQADEELEEAIGQIWEIASEFKMDPFPLHFEVVPPQVMYEIASQYLPERFSHWTHGRAYRQLKTMYDYGNHKIYELIINSNPAQAFLVENNPVLENKFVVAHVMGHSDFFKNNIFFQNTRRDMHESAALCASRIRNYEEEYGRDKVETVLDAVLAIEDHIDPFMPANRPTQLEELKQWQERARRQHMTSVETGEFDDLFALEVQNQTRQEREIVPGFPPSPDKDILGFIRNHAPDLADWERDIVDIVRSDSFYFYPQKRTKILNEGWASFGHRLIMREMGYRGLLSPSENERWWELHASVMQPRRRALNPYYFGMKMLEYWVDYFNGDLSEEENSRLAEQGMPIYPKFEGRYKGDVLGSPGIERIREMIMINDDQSFIRSYFDQNISERMHMYVYEIQEEKDGSYSVRVKDKDWKQIRDAMVSSMVNCGDPFIVVVEGDYRKRRELYLQHIYDGRELDISYLEKTLPYIFSLWRRPVHLETVVRDGKEKVVFTCSDGSNIEHSKA